MENDPASPRTVGVEYAPGVGKIRTYGQVTTSADGASFVVAPPDGQYYSPDIPRMGNWQTWVPRGG